MSKTLYAKRSVSIPTELLEETDGQLRDGETFSAYVTDALRRQVERRKLKELLEEFNELYGDPDPVEVDRWRSLLQNQ